jgi:hypothetical protein
MDATEEHQIVAAGTELEGIDVDAVVDGGDIRQRRVPIGVADRHVGHPIGVLDIHGERHVRAEAVDGGDHRGVHQSGVGEGKEIEAVVDEVELIGPLEQRGDVERLPHLGIHTGGLRVPTGRHGRQPGRRDRIGGGEQRDIDSPGHQALGQQRHEQLPGPIVAGRHPPRDRGEHRHPQRFGCWDDHVSNLPRSTE